MYISVSYSFGEHLPNTRSLRAGEGRTDICVILPQDVYESHIYTSACAERVQSRLVINLTRVLEGGSLMPRWAADSREEHSAVNVLLA
jgi:hypothetical protein